MGDEKFSFREQIQLSSIWTIRIVIGSMAVIAVGTLSMFKLIEGYDWSWLSVTAPISCTVGPYVIGKVLGWAVKTTMKTMEKEAMR